MRRTTRIPVCVVVLALGVLVAACRRDSPPSPLASEGGAAMAQSRSLMRRGEESFQPPPTDAAIAPEPDDPLADAKAAFDRGEYERALELAKSLATPCAASFCVRALANTCGAHEAERAASDAAVRYPLDPEIHLLHSVLLLDLHRSEDATQAAKRALYLDRSLAFGHFVLGLALSRLHDVEGAERAFRNARELCVRQRPDDAVAFSDGQRAGRFAEAVTAQLELLAGGAAS
jgi:chemotaxis protein methyltransferase CheR